MTSVELRQLRPGLPVNRRSALGLVLVGVAFFGYLQLTENRGPERPTGSVSVPIVSSREDAEALTRSLEQRGAGITVKAVPVSPQLVGTWVSVNSDGEMEPGLYSVINDEALGNVVTLDLPTAAKGLTLEVGVTPDAGQNPRVEGLRNAFAPRRDLECSPARGASPAEARSVLESRGYTVGFARFPDLSDPVQPAPDDVVTMAFIPDDAPKQVTLTVVAAGDPQEKVQLDDGFSPSQVADGDACNDLA